MSTGPNPSPASGSNSPSRGLAAPRGALRWLLGLPTHLYRMRLGFLLGRRFVVLIHEGRRSGRRYETPLEVVRYDASSGEATVVAGWGRRTAWLHNVEAGLAREIWIGRDRWVPVWRRLSLEEAVAVLERYERRSGLPRAVVNGVLSRLLGWRYRGTPAERRRAVKQLPLIAFRPRTRSGRTLPGS